MFSFNLTGLSQLESSNLISFQPSGFFLVSTHSIHPSCGLILTLEEIYPLSLVHFQEILRFSKVSVFLFCNLTLQKKKGGILLPSRSRVSIPSS